MAQATGRASATNGLPQSKSMTGALVRNLYAGRVKSTTRSASRRVTVHLVGGHTGRLADGAVQTARGAVVLASDAVHYWMNLADRNPFRPPTSWTRRSVRKVEDMVEDRDHIIPGHDPLVLSRSRRCAQSRYCAVDLAPSGLYAILDIGTMKATRRAEVVTVGSSMDWCRV